MTTKSLGSVLKNLSCFLETLNKLSLIFGTCVSGGLHTPERKSFGTV